MKLKEPRGYARMSTCGKYRYSLTRTWGRFEHRGGRRRCVFVALNPSTAPAEVDDPTIRRMVGFAQREACDELEVVNLFALRATKPSVLLRAKSPVGPENDMAIRDAVTSNALVIVAWGSHEAARRRAPAVLRILAHAHGRRPDGSIVLPGVFSLGLTKDGAPRHPLYLRKDAPLVPFPLPMHVVPCRAPGWCGKTQPTCDTCSARAALAMERRLA